MKLLVFDIDGTLFKSNKISDIAYKKALEEMFGIKSYSTQWEKYESCSDIGILREICRYNGVKNVDRFVIHKFEDLYLQNVKEMILSGLEFDKYNRVKDFIGEVLAEGIGISIYTGGYKKIALCKLDSLGIRRYMLPLASAYEGYYRKEIFTAAVYKAKVYYGINNFESVVVFGDSYQDIKLSKELNVPMIGVTSHLPKSVFDQEKILSVADYDKMDMVKIWLREIR